MRVITLTSLSALPRARALARSLSAHQPDWSHELLLVASEDVAGSVAEAEGILGLRSVCLELDLDIEALLALHDEQDLTALLLPSLLARYAERSAEPVLHLPSSVWVLGELDPIESALAARGVLLVPRLMADVPEDGLQPSREQMQRMGRMEETIMAIDGTPRSTAFLEWWRGHVEQTLGSLDARGSGERPEDRPWLARFLELAPARFSTGVLDDPGCNLNMWNLDRHSLRGGPAGELVDGRWPLRFLNMPGFDPDHPYRLSPGASRARVSRSPVLHELCERYAAELRASGWRDSDHHADVGRRLDGLVYDESLRAAFASALALGACPQDLFSEHGTRAFLAWLQGPAPRGGAYGINRYVFHRVARERPDVVRKYPDLDGGDGPGYLAWCWAFGRHELGIPERFMPPPPGEGPGRVAPAAESQRTAARPAVRAASIGSTVSSAAAGGRRALASEDELAVRLTGYLGHTLGLGAAARGYAQALGAASVPVMTVSVPLHHLALPVVLGEEYGRHGFEDLVHDGRHGFEIVAVNADELPDLVERLGEDYFEGPRIGIWGWETNTIPTRWERAFALVEEIWVYSRFMAENIGAVAQVPVIALPPPVQRPSETVAPLRLGVPEGFLFLFVFDYLSTVQRKNPIGLIEAFKLAFAPGEGPQLLIKTINAPLRPLAEEELLWAAHGREDIHVVDRSLNDDELNGLMAACDCYVSLHRAEGFGLTLAEAMAIGKPAIATGYSGNVDFMNSENSYLVDYTIGRVGPECEIYPPEGEWAEPSVEHAAELMRRVLDDPREARRRGARAAQDIARALSPAATGAAMRDRLQQLTRGSGASGAQAAVNGGRAARREALPRA
jgi:glycosyltransferase involved in cell wall biosynthesis